MGKLLLCVAKKADWCQRKIHREFFLPGGLASVDHEYVSGHVCRGVRRQKYRSTFQIVIAPETAKRDLCQQRLFAMLDDPLGHTCREPSRGNGIHLNVVGRPLACKILGECDNAALASVVSNCL